MICQLEKELQPKEHKAAHPTAEDSSPEKRKVNLSLLIHNAKIWQAELCTGPFYMKKNLKQESLHYLLISFSLEISSLIKFWLDFIRK